MRVMELPSQSFMHCAFVITKSNPGERRGDLKPQKMGGKGFPFAAARPWVVLKSLQFC